MDINGEITIMKFIEIFLSAFWPGFIGSQVGWSIAWLAKRSTSDTVLPFLGPKSFKELSNFPDGEQKRLLQAAAKEAFGHWRWFIEFVLFPLTFSFAGVFGSTFLKIIIPDVSSWASSCSAGAFAGLAFWIVTHLEICYLRPFLENHINGTQHVS